MMTPSLRQRQQGISPSKIKAMQSSYYIKNVESSPQSRPSSSSSSSSSMDSTECEPFLELDDTDNHANKSNDVRVTSVCGSIIRIVFQGYWTKYCRPLLLCGLATSLYFFSLRGGDLKWSNQHAAELVILILTSLALYIASFLILFLYTPTTSKSTEWFWMMMEKGIVTVGMFGTMIMSLLYDQGADLEHHGSFNALLFLLVGSPVVLFLLSLGASFRIVGRRTTLTTLVILTGILSLVFVQRTIASQRAWKWGLHSKHMDDDYDDDKSTSIAPATCRIARHRFWDVPWPGVMSYKPIFDLVVEKEDCLAKLPNYQSYSRIHKGKLYVNCNSPNKNNHNSSSSSSSSSSMDDVLRTASLRQLKQTSSSSSSSDYHKLISQYEECPWDSKEDDDDESNFGKVVSKEKEWPLKLCRPKRSNSNDDETKSAWFVAHVDVLQQFETWESIPQDVQSSMTQEEYSQPIRLGHIPIDDSSDEIEVELPKSFQKTGGLLSLTCPNVSVENIHLVAPNPSNKEEPKRSCDDENSSTKLDVHFLMIDSIGRAHTHRILTKTMKTLETLTQPAKLGESPWMQSSGADDVYFFEFFRFHSIGYNTGPNFGAIFYNEPSAEDAMTNAEDIPSISTEQMIWNVLKRASPERKTALINELCQDMGYSYGNNQTGLDHNVFLPFCDKEAFPHPTPYGNFEGPFSTRRRCLNGRQQHEHIFDWIEDFIEMHNEAGVSWFLTSIFMEGHEATGELLKRSVDERLSQHFSKFMTSSSSFNDPCYMKQEKEEESSSVPTDKNALHHTLQFLFGDHGLHMGPYAQLTRLGKIENFTPTLMLTVPGWFLRKYPEAAEALTINQYRLLSVFDLYAGVASLVTLEEFSSSSSDEPQWKGLFQIQSESRTCQDAQIPEKYCHCN